VLRVAENDPGVKYNRIACSFCNQQPGIGTGINRKVLSNSLGNIQVGS